MAGSHEEDYADLDFTEDEEYDDPVQLKADLEKAQEENKKLAASKQKNEF